MRRFLIWLLVLVLLAAGGVAGWWFLRGGDAKADLEAILTRALGREVHIGVLEVDPRGHVTLHDVEVANPEGWAGTPLLTATRFDLDVELSTLLDREVIGVVKATGVELRLIKHAGTTNLAGLLRPRSADGGKSIDLHLDVAITGARVLLEDHDRAHSLTLEGVDVRVLVTNRDQRAAAEASVRIAEVGLAGLPLREVKMTVLSDQDGLAINDLSGTLGERGQVIGAGRLFLAGERDWQFEVTATDVDLDGDVRRLVAAVYPPLSSSVDATAATGRIGASLSLTGAGVHWEQVRPTLAGTGALQLHDVVLPSGSLLVGIAGLVGRGDEPWRIASATIAFGIVQGWITLGAVTADGATEALPITGRVSLTGELDLAADLMPLVPLFGGGLYREVAKHATSLPVRIRGTLDHPELAPPSLADVSKSLLGGLIRSSLGGAPR